MTRIGFIGLGIMGLPMATNLATAGFEVVAYNRTPKEVPGLTSAGGRLAPSIAEAVEGADFVAIMVADTPDVIEVMLQPAGVLATAHPGTTVIDFSTIRPDATRDLHERARDAGMAFLDAPVSGGEVGAIAGSLSVMVGGEIEAFAAAAAVFEAVGATIAHVGPSGSGQIVKAANQLLVAGHLGLLAEAVLLLEGHGVETDVALTVLGGGLAGSTVLERKGKGMVARSFDPGFRARLHDKDMRIVAAAARAAGLATPFADLAAQSMAELNAAGYGELDHSAILLLAEQRRDAAASPGA